jgi:hypothetical protein
MLLVGLIGILYEVTNLDYVVILACFFCCFIKNMCWILSKALSVCTKENTWTFGCLWTILSCSALTFFFGSAGVWTQDLMQNKCSTTWILIPVLLALVYFRQGLTFFQGLASDWDLPTSASQVAGMTDNLIFSYSSLCYYCSKQFCLSTDQILAGTPEKQLAFQFFCMNLPFSVDVIVRDSLDTTWPSPALLHWVCTDRTEMYLMWQSQLDDSSLRWVPLSDSFLLALHSYSCSLDLPL